MSVQSALALVAAAGVIAFGLRTSMIIGLANVSLHPRIERGLSYIGPAVLASLAMNFAFGSAGGISVHAPQVLALIAGLGIALWKRNLLLSLAVAMPVLWISSAVLV